MGDLLGFPKGLIVNFVVRTVKKMVPPWSLPGHIAFNAAIAAGKGMTYVRPELGPDDVAVLQYTGGTTGVAKGATLLHHTIVANLLASEAWMQPGLKRKPISGQITIVCALPLYHVFAFVTCGLLGMRTGALNILIPNPRDMAGTIKELAKYHINIFPGVNTLFNGLANRPDFAKLDFSHLVISNGGGMAVQEAVAKKWLAITGCPIVEGYGLSETSAGVTCNPTDSEEYTGTIGLPMPNASRDPHPRRRRQRRAPGRGRRDRNQRPAGHAGVLAATRRDGPRHDPGRRLSSNRATSASWTPAASVRIVDRKKDMIVVSGFKVFPNEIEAVVASMPGVLECAAIGVPDAGSGEAVMLFIVKKDASLTKEQVAAYCAREFTGYKRPKFIEFRADLPKTNVGKILRAANCATRCCRRKPPESGPHPTPTSAPSCATSRGSPRWRIRRILAEECPMNATKLLVVMAIGLSAAACESYSTTTTQAVVPATSVVVTTTSEQACSWTTVSLPGTVGYDRCVSREHEARLRGRVARTYSEAQLADDARAACLSYGLEPVSPHYDRCVGREMDARRYRDDAAAVYVPASPPVATVYPSPSYPAAPYVETRNADTTGVQAFRDEYGFRYDAQGNRLDRYGNIISPHSTQP